MLMNLINPQTVSFSPQFCEKLKAQQLFVQPSTAFQGGNSAVFPLAIGTRSFCSLSSFGAYSELQNNVSFNNSTLGNYCTVSSFGRIGIGEHEMNSACLSESLYAHSAFSYHANIPATCIQPTAFKYGNSLMPPVTIDHDVLIESHVLLPRSVHIGTGAVLQHRSIITKDVPPFAIVSGNNTIIGQRFSDEICADLLESKWWEYDIPALQKAGIKVPVDDPQRFLEFLSAVDTSTLPKVSTEKTFFVARDKNNIELYSLEQLLQEVQQQQKNS